MRRARVTLGLPFFICSAYAGTNPRTRRPVGGDIDPLQPACARGRGGLARLCRVARWPTGQAAHHGDRGAAQVDPHLQPVARCAVRPLGECLSRLRAWLRLLLCASHPRLSRPLAGPRFRDEAVRKARCGKIAAGDAGQEGLPAAAHRDGHQHRSLSTDRAHLADHPPAARSVPGSASPRHHHHQVRPGAGRCRPAGRDGAGKAGRGLDLGNEPRSGALGQARTALRFAGQAIGCARKAGGTGGAGALLAIAGHPGDHGRIHGRHHRPGWRTWCEKRRLDPPAPAPRSRPAVPRMAGGPLPRACGQGNEHCQRDARRARQ